MESLLCILCILCFASSSQALCGSKSGGPQDNPVASFYGNGTYPWADDMVNWTCVYNVKDYGGSFENAQKAAAANEGGSVVYFPSGSYTFKANIVIMSNVVIRGEPTTDTAKKGTSPGPLKPKTIFKCTFGEHIGIFNSDPKGSNFGIVNVELDGCPIMFWPGLKSDSKSVKGYWWTAEDVVGMGSNKVVLGNLIHDVAYLHPDPDDTSDKTVWPYSFSIAIASYSDNNTLVGNNLISKSKTSMKTTVVLDNDKVTVPFPVDNRYGIDVNTILLGGVIGKYLGHKCPSQQGTLTPSCFPSFFRPGLVIRDNYVYMNGRVGINYSGGGDGKTVGSGTLVYNNHVEVAAGTTCWTINGKKKMTGHDTNENRGYDQKGFANNVTMNTGHINRQKAADTGYMTVDGEGILMQAVNGNDGLHNLWYKNDLSGGSTGYIAFYNLFNVENNQLIGNKAASGEFIGVVTDSTHHNVKNNVCRDNIPKCKGM